MNRAAFGTFMGNVRACMAWMNESGEAAEAGTDDKGACILVA